jgi:hypothetical protein
MVTLTNDIIVNEKAAISDVLTTDRHPTKQEKKTKYKKGPSYTLSTI